MSNKVHYFIYTGILICMVITNIQTANTINAELIKVHNKINSVQEDFKKVYHICIVAKNPDLWDMLEINCKDPKTENDYEKCKKYNLISNE